MDKDYNMNLKDIKKIIPSQKKFITRVFGDKEANRANYSWVTDDDGYLTKVYTTPLNYVESFIDESGKVVHHSYSRT